MEKITDKAKASAGRLGFTEAEYGRLVYMMDNSAPFTHAVANRRFEDFGLIVKDGELQDIIALH